MQQQAGYPRVDFSQLSKRYTLSMTEQHRKCFLRSKVSSCLPNSHINAAFLWNLWLCLHSTLNRARKHPQTWIFNCAVKSLRWSLVLFWSMPTSSPPNILGVSTGQGSLLRGNFDAVTVVWKPQSFSKLIALRADNGLGYF